MNEIQELNRIISEFDNIVFFGGAGVSTESGIPDFRSTDGLYNQKYDYPPEEILSHSFFIDKPEEFYKFYFDKLVVTDIKPNINHTFLKDLEDKGKLKAIITQNIDGLHEMAGSKNIINLHGSIYHNHCYKCNKYYSLDNFKHEGIPRCECGGIIKPDVVLYEESLSSKSINDAIYYISNADVLIVAGTSLNVYPAAGFINYFKGKKLIVINKDPIKDIGADLVINDKLGNVFKNIKL